MAPQYCVSLTAPRQDRLSGLLANRKFEQERGSRRSMLQGSGRVLKSLFGTGDLRENRGS